MPLSRACVAPHGIMRTHRPQGRRREVHMSCPAAGGRLLVGGGEEILLQLVLYGWRESWADEHDTTQLSPSVNAAGPVITLG